MVIILNKKLSVIAPFKLTNTATRSNKSTSLSLSASPNINESTTQPSESTTDPSTAYAHLSNKSITPSPSVSTIFSCHWVASFG